ncbi:MAG: VWA domain-containing protein [Alphaproteobacteria bacterium]|nr:VWA domain-containing protein [Alphaproteobacteria bacterium]
MHRSILVVALALSGCAAYTLSTPADAAPMPSGQMKVDMSCFGGGIEESAKRKSSGWGYGAGSAGAAAPAAKGTRARPSSPPPAPPPAMSAPSMSKKDYAMEEADMGAADDGFGAPVTMPPYEPEPAPDMEPARQQAPRQQALDWGGETWLSNDDSMSLASAQRVLWAVQNGYGWSTDQIRPHELLNYFSFDTETPGEGETFEVTASAEQHGDSLAVAFAVQGANPPRQPLDLTMVVDRSCSMSDEGRMDYTKRGLTKMTDQLDKGDRIDIVLFDDKVCTPLENFVVGRDDMSVLKDVISRMQPEGGTDMNLGLKEGYAVASRKADTHRRNRRVMAITDALLNTGDINHDTVSEIGKQVESDGIRLTGIGVGRDFNDDVLNKLTEKGKGAYVYLGSEAVVDRVFGDGFDGLVQTIAHDVRFKLDLPESLALERFYGEEASTVKEDIQPIHYYAGTSQVFLQDLKIHPKGLVPTDKVKLEVEWRDAMTGEPEKRTFHVTVDKMLEADPHNVRKARTLMAFSDVLTARSMGADACGEPLTEYSRRTSGVEGDAEIAYVDGLVNRVCPSWDRTWTPPVAKAKVNLKVKVDSDIPIAEVAASCASDTQSEGLSAADTVARFSVVPGRCQLTLQGAVPMTTTIDVAETGTDVRCLIRGGRMQCS